MRGVADRSVAVSPAAPPFVPAAVSGVNIDPITGLSTDYLNHFTEAIMVLEMVSMLPDCLPDLQAWEPKTYREHFAASHFSNRDDVIAAYDFADPKVREALDTAAETLNAVLAETRDVVVLHLASPVAAELAERAVAWLRPLVARTAAVINGTAPGSTTERLNTQSTVDALFTR